MSNEVSPQPAEDDTGGQGALFTRRGEERGDCRMVARMLALGVVSEERAAKLVAKAFKMAGRETKPREFAAMMRVILEMVKIDQKERHKMLDSQVISAAGSQGVGVSTGVVVNISIPTNGREPPSYVDAVLNRNSIVAESNGHS